MNATLLSARAPVFSFIAVVAGSVFGAAPELYREPFRPQFHFAPEKNWMNDPNGLVFFDDEYHLFYQHNPFGDKWGHMSWGHAASRDLVHWKQLPLALAEQDQVMIFSGSAVVDWNNSSGFGLKGKPPLVAIYTGHSTARPLQNQDIAYSNDRGRTWTKYSGNPVLDIGERDFRDPKVRWHEPTRKWIMTVAWPVQRKVRFYSSPDLKKWTHLSDFGPAGSKEGIWECPDLFPIRFQNTTQWVLIVNVGSGAPAGGSGCQYFVGNFDGTEFHPAPPGKNTAPGWADFGPDFYAAVSWSDIPRRDGRILWLGWMSNWTYANDIPTAPWRNAMSIPRELELFQGDVGLELRQRPARELKKLRASPRRFKGGTITAANDWIRKQNLHGNQLELSFQLNPFSSGIAGIKLLKGNNEETEVGIDSDQSRIYIDRTRSGNIKFHSRFSAVHSAPIRSMNKPVQFRIFVDACSVELFFNDGERVLSELTFPSPGSDGLEFFGSNPGVRVNSLEAWTLKSTWLN